MASFSNPIVLTSMSRGVGSVLLDDATDEQLVAELERRHPDRVLEFSEISDEQLRAECERRRVFMASDRYGAVLADNARLETERDEWKRRAEAAEGMNKLRGQYLRDISNACLDAGMPEGMNASGNLAWLQDNLRVPAVLRPGEHPPVPRAGATWPDDPLTARVKAENGGRIPTAEESMRKAMLYQERGPGIAAKPPQSEPLAFLDEDLLADDA